METAKPTPLEDGESDVETIATQRRADLANSRQEILTALRTHRNDFSRLQRDAFESVRHTVLDVDAKGNVRSTTGRGVPTGYSANALVKCNMASRKARAQRIGAIIKDLDLRIEALERGGPVDAAFDFKKFREANFVSIPDDDEMAVIQSPKGEAVKGAPRG